MGRGKVLRSGTSLPWRSARTISQVAGSILNKLPIHLTDDYEDYACLDDVEPNYVSNRG